MSLQIKEIIRTTGGSLISGNPALKIRDISIDTRTLFKGDLFIALKGENFDGHSFLEEAFKKGAVGAVVSEDRGQKTEDRRQRTENRNRVIIKVKDTLHALGDIAKIYREKFSKIKVIAVTGSNGKTTTKEILAHILSKKFKIVKAKASFNNFVGVPLTLLEIKNDTQVVVLEMETSIIGGIKRLCEISSPSIGIITNIGDTHLEYLKTKESVFKEKSELIEALPDNGTTVLNFDDVYVVRMKGLTRTKRMISFGIEKRVDFRASEIEIKDTFLQFVLNPIRSNPLQADALDIECQGTSNGVNNIYKIRLNTIFYKNIYNALAALTVSHSVFDLDLGEVITNLGEFRFPPMRMELIDSSRAGEDITIINDCHNANPQSMEDALLTLKNIQASGRRIAVLGDMLELGEKTLDFHYQLGKLCPACKVDILITMGDFARHIAKGAKDAGMLKENIFDNTQNAIEALFNILKPKDVILIKGSRKMGMERIADALIMARPQSKGSSLNF